MKRSITTSLLLLCIPLLLASAPANSESIGTLCWERGSNSIICLELDFRGSLGGERIFAATGFDQDSQCRPWPVHGALIVQGQTNFIRMVLDENFDGGFFKIIGRIDLNTGLDGTWVDDAGRSDALTFMGNEPPPCS